VIFDIHMCSQFTIVSHQTKLNSFNEPQTKTKQYFPYCFFVNCQATNQVGFKSVYKTFNQNVVFVFNF